MFLGYNLSLLTPFIVPDTVFITIPVTIYSGTPTPYKSQVVFGYPPPPRVCTFEIKLSVVCAGAFSFFMLFMGKLALCDGGFSGFLCIVCFSMYNFIKSQAFIRGVNCIFLCAAACVFFLAFCVCFVYNDSKIKVKKLLS